MRLLLVLPIVHYLLIERYDNALWCVFFAALSDALDGLLARKLGYVTRFGSIADPLADKLLLLSCFAVLVYLAQLPLWLLALVIFRDIYIILGAIAYHVVLGPFQVTPYWSGKLNSFFQIVLVVSTILTLNFGVPSAAFSEVMVYVVAVFCGLSVVHSTWVWSRRAQRSLRRQPL